MRPCSGQRVVSWREHIIRLDVYGPDRTVRTKAKPRKQRRSPEDIEWLAANKRSRRKKPVDKQSRMEVEYRKATKRRLERKRPKKRAS